MLRAALFAISLSLAGCASALPEFPEIWQCAFDGNPKAFYCVNTRTGARLKVAADDPRMKGAQCMSLDDYRKSERWVQQVKLIAEQRCR